MLDELKKLEPDFNESIFISKVNNIFVAMLNSIMFQDASMSVTSLGPNLKEDIIVIIATLKSRNAIQMYGEMNVHDTKIMDVQVLEDKYVIKVQIMSRYLDYLMDATSKKKISGDDYTRVERANYLLFEEKRDHKKLGDVTECPFCGANIDYNYKGICEYCKKELPKENYDWILVDWKEVKD